MDAILLSAGSGKRMNLDYPKQFYKIGGKPFFIYSLEVLRKVEDIDNIIITIQNEYKKEYEKIIFDYKLSNISLVTGGKTRQESVYFALKHVKSKRVLIHEAARPLISVDFVSYILSFRNEIAVVPTIPVKFSVSIGDKYMEKELNRNKLNNIQLPQVFDKDILFQAHERAIKDKYLSTEDGTLIFHYGGKVRFVKGRESNIKITTPMDINVVNNLIKF